MTEDFTLHQQHNKTGGTDLVLLRNNHALMYMHAGPDGLIDFVDKLRAPMPLEHLSIGQFIRNWRLIAIETLKLSGG